MNTAKDLEEHPNKISQTITVDVTWTPKGYKYIRIGRPEYGELFIFNGNIYQYNDLPFRDLLTGEILNTCPPLPLIIVSCVSTAS